MQPGFGLFCPVLEIVQDGYELIVSSQPLDLGSGLGIELLQNLFGVVESSGLAEERDRIRLHLNVRRALAQDVHQLIVRWVLPKKEESWASRRCSRF